MHCTPTRCQEYNGRKSVKPSWQSITAKACGRSPACEGKPTMKEIMNKTLVVKFESTSPIKTVFNDGGAHVELSGVDLKSPHKEWHHVIINEEAWRMFSPHVHIGDSVKFTGRLTVAEPGEKKYYEHTMKNGHKYPIGYLRDTVPTGFIAAPKVESDCPWANDERSPLVGWDDLPIRKADDGNTDKKVSVR